MRSIVLACVALASGALAIEGACAAEAAKVPHAAKPKTHAAGKPVPAAQPAREPGTIPMDFSGMSRNVQDVSTPSNARANTGYGGQGAVSMTPGFMPTGSMKF